MPMAYGLAPGVHGVAVDRDLVLLDVESGAYFCLPNATPDLELDAARRVLSIRSPGLASELAETRLVRPTHADLASVSPPLPVRPIASAFPRSCAPPRWGDLPEAARCLLDVLIHYRGRSFAEIVRSVASTPSPRRDPPPTTALLEVVSRFHRWIPYAPVSGKCLLRCFMLLRLIRRQGHDARWVFGVSTWPFQAHCWLQCGDVVLDDAFERLWLFQPLMAI